MTFPDANTRPPYPGSPALPSPIVDPNVDPSTAQRLLSLGFSHASPHEVRSARVGFSDLRSASNYSVVAMLVAPPSVVLVEHRYGRADEGLDVVQAFLLDRVVQFASASGQCFLVIDSVAVDSARTGFQVEGPLVSLPMFTPASELLLG